MNHRVKRVFVLTRWLYHLENLKINVKRGKRTYDTERDKNDKMINVYYKPSQGSNNVTLSWLRATILRVLF